MNLKDITWEEYQANVCSIIDQVLDPDRRYALLVPAHAQFPILKRMHREYYRLRDLPEWPGQKYAMEMLERDMTVLLALWQISHTPPNASGRERGGRLSPSGNGQTVSHIYGREPPLARASSPPTLAHDGDLNLPALTYHGFYQQMSSIHGQLRDPDQRRALFTTAYSEVPLLERMHAEHHRLRDLPQSPEQEDALELLGRDITVLLALWRILSASPNARRNREGTSDLQTSTMKRQEVIR